MPAARWLCPSSFARAALPHLIAAGGGAVVPGAAGYISALDPARPPHG
jgi:hypothetical protein